MYRPWKAIGFYSSGESEIEEILDGSPTFATHRSAHFFGLFLVSGRISSGYRYRMKKNTLSYVSCIATVSNNAYSLHSATILTHTIACSHIFFSETKPTSFRGSLFSASLGTTKGDREERLWERGWNKTLLFLKWRQKPTRPILRYS